MITLTDQECEFLLEELQRLEADPDKYFIALMLEDWSYEKAEEELRRTLEEEGDNFWD